MQNNLMREQRISFELEELRQQQNLMITDCEYDGLLREDFWVLWVTGKIDTDWQGMVIPVQISFPQDYPMEAPHIQFPKDFQHIHVYEGGQICLPILEHEYWKPKSSMVQLIRRTINLLHQQINPYSPANHSLYSLYKTDRMRYEKIMNEQKQKYRIKDHKYYRVPSVHIDIYQDENV